MTVINKLEKLIEEERQERISYSVGLLPENPEELKTDTEKLDYLDEIEFNGEVENLAYSLGYEQGLRTAIGELQK